MATNRRVIRRLVGALVVFSLVLILHYTHVLRLPEQQIIRTLGVLQRPFSALGIRINRTVGFFRSIKTLASDNTRMADEIRRLTGENAALQEVKRENAALRDQLELSQRTDLTLTSALVIGRDGSQVSQALTINKGSTDGIKKDEPVVISTGILIGRVFEVADHTAKVLLTTDSNSLVNALVQDTRASGIIRGEHGLGLIIDTIPQNEVIQENALVITSGLGGIFPKGLVIGKIKEIHDSDNALFQQASVQPLFNPRDLEVVFVVLDSQPEQ